MKTLLGLFVCFVCFVVSAQLANTYPRISVTLHCSNAVVANNIYQAITNRVGPLDEFTNDNRNVEIVLATNVPGASYSLQCTYLFLNTNRAENVWNYLTNRVVPAQTSGKFTYHFCPAEGAFRDWPGCDQSGYRELLWP